MGDFQHKFSRPDAGSHTVEGNVSGARAARLEQQRQAQQDEFEQEKLKRQRTIDERSRDISTKFQRATVASKADSTFRQKTVGLVTADEFVKAAKETNDEDGGAEKLKQQQLEKVLREAEEQKLNKKKKKRKRKEAKQMASLLSFADDADVELLEADEGDPSTQQPTIRKDPTVDTSFLPDKERENQIAAERIRLEQEWKEKQKLMKQETLEITYSYWDGSGHRRTCQITKGAAVGDFLEVVRKDLSREFRELSNVASDALLYVKEDLILPHDLTFYDLIATKARGKSGPLFHFDVHEDVRTGPLDRRIEKDESHPGKVVERRWYERNKHIFPASRWEVYDPSKEYGKYTIHGGEVVKKKGK